MSLAAIRLERVIRDDTRVVYSVRTTSFSSDSTEQEIGTVEISLPTRELGPYVFTPLGPLLGKRVLPPHVYDLKGDAFRSAISTEYPGFSYGAWVGRVNTLVRRMQRTGEFPEAAVF
jgi:hypothetical protein